MSTTQKFARTLLVLCLALATPCLWARKISPTGNAPRGSDQVPEQPARTIVTVAYLKQQPADDLTQRPFFDPIITEPGLNGARLGILDNNTTGQFTRQSYRLKEVIVPPENQATDAFKALAREGLPYVLLDLPADLIDQIALLPEARKLLLLDISSRDDSLRESRCRPNVLHLQPSNAMRADALAQYLMKKRWKRWFLAEGNDPEDRLLAEAIRKSAKKFGAKLVSDKLWNHHFDDRRTPESEVPVFTQQDDYDVIVVADGKKTFGDLIAYRSWLPRPVVGSTGLKAVSWDKTHEAWGALQLQNRFHELAGYWMTETDYAAWLAIRAIGEAATRTQSVDPDVLKTFILGPQFSIAGFKGVPLSFRAWDNQLRQPVLLAGERSLVTVAPIDGYLHPKNELDTLGSDEAESTCKF